MNERIDTNSRLVEGLLGDILSVKNLNEAFKRVKRNKGSHGTDGMSIQEMDAYLRENGRTLRNALMNGKYCPHPVSGWKFQKTTEPSESLAFQPWWTGWSSSRWS